MVFTYRYKSEDTSNKLFTTMTNELNSLTTNEQLVAKTATNDIKGGTAKGTIITTNSAPPSASNIKNSLWIKESWSNSSTQNNVKSCVDFLNNSNLSDAQKYYSRIGISNVESGNAYLVLFYQK